MALGLGDYLKSRIEPDLQAFADRGSVTTDWVSGADGRGELTAVWGQSGQEYPGDHRFRLVGGAIQYVDGANKPISYAKFLQKVAELGPISRAMYGNGEGILTPSGDFYVPTKSQMDDQGPPEDSDKMLLKEIGADLEGEQFKTRVFFVKGDAGAGKTTLLERIKVEQAQKFAAGKADFLFFYVSAQGRALSNLDEAIAKELDDLRAIFSHRLRGDGVLALARNGLLVPIVDGFDELLGTQGYGDAFSSLRNFLNRLDGVGVMVVSARSAFYEAEFVQRASASMSSQAGGARFEVVPVSLLEWEDSELFQFLARSRKMPQIAPKDMNRLNALPPRDRALLKKPFFAKQFIDYVDGGHSTEFLEFLANAYIERESHKIVGRDGNPLLQPKHHRRIFVGIAEEMWGSGKNRELRKGDLQTVAELALDKFKLPEDTIAQVREKIGSDAFIRFARVGGQDKFLFGHDVYFEYFLSQMIRDKLLEGGWHKEGTLDIGVFPAVAVRLAIQNAETARACLQMANDISQMADLPKENRALNMGQMLASSFALLGEQEASCDGVTIRGVTFRDCTFGKARLDNVRFLDCRFSEVNLSDCSLKECVAEACHADGPLIVSSDTRLGITGFVPGQNVLVIHYHDREGDNKREDIWNPQRMDVVIRQLGDSPSEVLFLTYSDKASGFIDLMRRVANAFRTASTLCEDDKKLTKIFRTSGWEELRKILVEHGMIVEDKRATGHASRERMFLRKAVSSMDEVLAHETTPDENLPDGKIGDFWRTLRGVE